MFKTFAVLMLAAIPGSADVQIKASYNADGQTAETTIWSKGNRMRYDYGNGVVMLRFCDQGKMVQIDDKNKSFLTLPAQEQAKANSGAEVTDTEERKELFGRQARHLKIVESVEGKDGKKERTETDGWYFDLQGLGACFGPSVGSVDRGYPASYSIVSYSEDRKASTKVTMQVVSMTEAPLASSMFEVPTGYQDTTPREIPKAASPKAAGAVRIGALPVHDKSSPGGRNDALYGRLAAQLMDAKLDLVQLEDGPQDAVSRKAQETACDFVLYSEVSSLEKPAAGGKVGGLLRKAPGLGKVTAGDGMEAHIDYRLVPATGGAPVLASSATGKAGTAFNLKGAAMLASNVLPMAMAARMFGGALNPTMMNALASGRGVGASMANVDPMMGGITSLIQAAMPGQVPQAGNAQSPTAQEAVAAAIELEGKAVIAQVRAGGR